MINTMNSLFKNLWFCLFLCLINCKNASIYENLYARKGRKSTSFSKKYISIDSVHLRRLSICKETIEVGEFLNTNGQLKFNLDSLEHSITISFQKHFELLKNKKSEKFDWSQNCKNYTRKNLAKYKTKSSADSLSKHIIDVSFNIEHETSKNMAVLELLYLMLLMI